MILASTSHVGVRLCPASRRQSGILVPKSHAQIRTAVLDLVCLPPALSFALITALDAQAEAARPPVCSATRRHPHQCDSEGLYPAP